MKCPNCQFDNLEDSAFCRKCGTRLPLSREPVFLKTLTLDTVQKIMSKGTLFAGKYRILGVLGQGGMGIVYQAEDTKLKRTVALKFLPAELSRHAEARERFIREAQAAAVLDHPHICTVHEAEEAEGVAYIAMAYVEGRSLRDMIARGPLAPEKAAEIALQVAEGLEAAHRRGIVHRDVKSGNIMVNQEGLARIMDFGLAKMAGESVLTREAKTMGTVAYMSPEQARGEETDHRTDIWSLGVVLYEMLTGELPFRGERETSIMYAIVHEEPRPPQKLKPNIPIDLIKIVEKSLRKDREARYATAADMANDLRRYLEAVKAEAAGLFSMRSLLRKLRKPQVAIPAALVLIALAALAFWFFNRQAKIRWAEKKVLAEVLRLYEKDDLSAAFDRAKEIAKYIPKNPQLIEVIPEIERSISVVTNPSKADVFIRDYREREKEWQFLGQTPILDKKISREFKRWKIVKEGYETVEGSDIIEGGPITKRVGSLKINIKLDPKGDLPTEMVRIPGGETEVGKLEDFLLDKFEVTNRKFKEFLDQGGYTKKEFWKYPFFKDGRVISREEAMAEFVDSTGRPGPSNWAFGDYPEGQDEYPVAGVSWYEAAAYAEFANKSLPTLYHWRYAAGILNMPFIVPLSNFEEKGIAPVGTYQGMSPYGTYDMGGNVKEWVWNEWENRRYNLGGGWNEPQYMFTDPELLPPMMRMGNFGFRCMKTLSEGITQEALDPVPQVQQRDFSLEKPCSEEVFKVLNSHYYYDKKDLNPVVESRGEAARYWIAERVTYDAGYSTERMISYLFLPKSSPPPYQTIVYFPGGAARRLNSISEYSIKRYDTFIKEGRAFIFPIYAGTFERRERAPGGMSTPTSRRDSYVKHFKEFARTLDYLETRPEFDKNKFVYFGLSWGASEPGFIITALEKRLKAAIFLCGGFHDIPDILPESNPVNFAPRIRLPFIMMNGIYDNIFPFETNVKVAFHLLGTPEKDKVLKPYASSHYLLTTNLWIKDALDFLDRYLGPVK